MKTNNALTTGRVGLLVCLGAAGLWQAPVANASMVLLETNSFFDSQSQMVSFVASGPGTFVAQLADLAWPQALSAFSFTASSASQVLSSWVMTPGNGPQTYYDTFTVDAAGTYWAQITGVASSGPSNSYDMGAYGISISFSPSAVPLPASDWMLAAGMLVLAGVTRLASLVRTPRAPGREIFALTAN